MIYGEIQYLFQLFMFPKPVEIFLKTLFSDAVFLLSYVTKYAEELVYN